MWVIVRAGEFRVGWVFGANVVMFSIVFEHQTWRQNNRVATDTAAAIATTLATPEIVDGTQDLADNLYAMNI